ncbi:SGNH/GDSL hydrolase family protein [Lacisediminimonas profundi]|uniref:SGNH/GDSL hydrolase family protein n=1 Tax=Lacisediminimonas profundi TaxID=2603856 RepID=UPI00124B49E8|nr:SGNH/GDSL hydrolase family protein [Lacisediminimonas profundi]
MEETSSPDGERLSNRAKWVALLALLAVILLLAFVGAEALLRMRQAAKYGIQNSIESRFTQDPVSGLRVPRAGFSSGPYSINSLGFRGPELTQPKPAQRLRIAYLGASTTACEEVSDNAAIWPHLATASLHQAFPARQMDYINGGVAGYTLRSSIRNLELRVAQHQPDVIVIYHATNDLSRELRELAVKQGLIPEGGFKEFSWPGNYSLLWNLAEKNLRVMAAQRAARDKQGRLRFDPGQLGLGFRDEYIALVRRAQHSAKLVALATFSTRLRKGQLPEEQQRSMASAIFYMPFMSFEGLLASYERYNNIIREVAAATGALLIEGEQDVPGTAEYFNDSVHFTGAGNRAMAQRIGSALAADPRFRALANGSAQAH